MKLNTHSFIIYSTIMINDMLLNITVLIVAKKLEICHTFTKNWAVDR